MAGVRRLFRSLRRSPQTAAMALCLAAPAQADMPACAEPLNVAWLEEIVTTRNTEGRITDALGLYHEICDGGLYLIDLMTHQALLRVNDQWLFWSLTSSNWSAPDMLTINAEFMTGIGPEAAVPFPVEFKLQRQDGAWVSQRVDSN